MSDINLLKRNSIYYFRMKIPQDIVPYINRREIWKSLKTVNHKNAKVIASKLLYHTERLFLHVRSGMYTDTQIRQLVNDYLHDVLNRCESIRNLGMVTYETDSQESVAADADAQTIIEKSVIAADELIETSKRKLMMNDFSGISVRLDWFIKEKGLSVDKGSVEHTKLCREILKAEIESLKIEKERVVGNYDNRYDRFLDNTITPPAQPLA